MNAAENIFVTGNLRTNCQAPYQTNSGVKHILENIIVPPGKNVSGGNFFIIFPQRSANFVKFFPKK